VQEEFGVRKETSLVVEAVEPVAREQGARMGQRELFSPESQARIPSDRFEERGVRRDGETSRKLELRERGGLFQRLEGGSAETRWQNVLHGGVKEERLRMNLWNAEVVATPKERRSNLRIKEVCVCGGLLRA